MLLVDASSRRAWNVPLLMGGLSLAFVTLCVFALRAGGSDWSWRTFLVPLFAVILTFVTLANLRRISVTGKGAEAQLLVRNAFGLKRLRLSSVAIGLTARHSARGITNHEVYAYDGKRDVALTETSSERRAEKYRHQLVAALLVGQVPDANAEQAARYVERREQRWRANQAEARRVAGSHSAAGAKRAALWVLAISVVGWIITMAWLKLSN